MRSLLAATTFIQQTAAIDHKQFIIKYSCALLRSQNITIKNSRLTTQKSLASQKSRLYAHKHVGNPLISDLFLVMKKSECNIITYLIFVIYHNIIIISIYVDEWFLNAQHVRK